MKRDETANQQATPKVAYISGVLRSTSESAREYSADDLRVIMRRVSDVLMGWITVEDAMNTLMDIQKKYPDPYGESSETNEQPIN